MTTPDKPVRQVPAGTTPQATDDETGMEEAMQKPEPNSTVGKQAPQPLKDQKESK